MAVDSSNEDQLDLVLVTIKIYKIKCQDGDTDSILVGEPGLYYPRHEDHMTWIPLGLISMLKRPIDWSGVMQLRIPRWLAVKKGLKFNE